MTASEQQVISMRLEYCRVIVRNLARARCADPKNFYLPQPEVRKVKELIRLQFKGGQR